MGCLLIGLLTAELTRHPLHRRPVKMLLGTGFLGRFATFSHLVDGVRELTVGGAPGWAAVYLVLSVLLGLLAVWAGIKLGESGDDPRPRGVRRRPDRRAGPLPDRLLRHRWVGSALPWGVPVNVLGSAVLGLVMGAWSRGALPPTVLSSFGTGFWGRSPPSARSAPTRTSCSSAGSTGKAPETTSP